MSPLQITAATVALIVSISGAVYGLEDRYSNKEFTTAAFTVVQNNTAQMLTDVRIEYVQDQLNQLRLLEAAGEASKYDIKRIGHLEKELDRLYQMKTRDL